MGKNKLFWPLGMAKKNFWHAMGFELCTPVLDVATKSQKDHKLYSTTYILCSKKICN